MNLVHISKPYILSEHFNIILLITTTSPSGLFPFRYKSHTHLPLLSSFQRIRSSPRSYFTFH